MTAPAPASALPALFVSHGAPNMILHPSAARTFLAGLAADLPRPTAILSVSAHFAAARPTVVADPHPAMIYDFGGFEPELYRMVYPAPGDPELAGRVAEALAAAGLEPAIAARRGYDHGTWVPLKLMYPDADIPVVQLSVEPRRDPRHHWNLGRAIAGLRAEGVLVLASGSLTHNLHEAFTPTGLRPLDAPSPAWVSEFADWVAAKVAAHDVEALLDYRRAAPHAVRNHPTDEHLLPLFVALGAGGEEGLRIHDSRNFAVLAMDAYRFAS
ncbi:dioxygenase [Siculibacillus lacustris]|uniref:Dioxygenase n=1 Tax=Siculibacillus lacustris TaxID=1549641 RepID=A0A4Q9VWZ9_9HYPH|nr:class III extradiol ring-cleavage dioxygenase [Siculibacillus lacustris]TBW40898.1 dioxygenase [Siculibacillus lacustris]